MEKMNLKSYIHRNPDIAWRYLGEYLIAITPKSNQVHRLNHSAVAIWKSLEGGKKTMASIVEDICELYDTDAHTASNDIQGFISEIAEKGLIEVSAS